MVGWCTLFLQVVAKEAPPNALPEEIAEREANHWWKAKKWAYFNLNRLFVRYVGTPLIADKKLTLCQIWQPRISTERKRKRV